MRRASQKCFSLVDEVTIFDSIVPYAFEGHVMYFEIVEYSVISSSKLRKLSTSSDCGKFSRGSMQTNKNSL